MQDFSLVTLQATLSLTAPKTPFVPPYIHNLRIFPTDPCVALSINTHLQVYVCVHAHTLARTDAHALALAPFLFLMSLSFSSCLSFLFTSVKHFKWVTIFSCAATSF